MSLQPFPSGKNDPDEFRRMIQILRDNPSSVLYVTGATGRGRDIMRRALPDALPWLAGRVFEAWGFEGRTSAPSYFVRGFPWNGETIELNMGSSVAPIDPFSLFTWQGLYTSLVGDIRAVVAKVGASTPEDEPSYRFFAPERIEWDVSTHPILTKNVRAIVKALLMARNRPTLLAAVPMEIMFMIFVRLQRLHWKRPCGENYR